MPIESLIEFFNERAGIREYDGKMERKEAERLAREDSESRRHDCEVSSLFRKYHEALFKYQSLRHPSPEKEAGKEITKYLLQVEKFRGSDSAKRLRNDTLKQINERKKNGNKT